MSNTLKLGNGKWATGKDTLLSFSDTNNNYKPLAFSFSRDSSATVVNKEGLIETVGSGEPRIDFKDNTKGSLLLEPQRTNSITYSEDFSQSAWVKSGTSVVSGFISPDGTANAFKLVESSANQAHTITGNAASVTSGATTTKSIIVKPNGRRWILILDIYKPSSRAWFDLELGVVGSLQASAISSSIEKLNNGYFRCSVTSAVNATSSQLRMDIVEGNNITSGYQGNGTSGVYIYAAQLEQGSYATSYIPTSGQANGVTRVGEVCSQTLPSAVPTSGVIYAEIELFNSVLDTSSTAIRYGINQTISSGNWIFFGIESGDNLRVYIRANDSTNFDYTLNNVFATAGVYKIAMRFAPNDTKVFVNGVQRASSENTVIASNLNNLNISGGGTAPSPVNNSVKNRDFRLYNTALTDQELIALTS